MEVKFFVSTSALNRHDLYPAVVGSILSLGYTKLTMDWAYAMDMFLKMQEEGELEDEHYARTVIRNNELAAIVDADIYILAVPGGRGSFFEYGTAYTKMVMTNSPAIIVYALHESLLHQELGHFVGMPNTRVVIGSLEDLAKAVDEMKSEMFQETLVQ